MEHLLPILLLFPGILVRRLRFESGLEFLASRLLISIGFNGLLARSLLDAGYYEMWIVGPYLLVGAVVTVSYVLLRWRSLLSLLTQRNKEWGLQLFVFLFAVYSLYWSLFFPPLHFDSVWFHLNLADVFSRPERYEYYLNLEYPDQWVRILRGALGGCNVEAFISIYLKYGSELYRLVPPLVGSTLLVGTHGLARTLGLAPVGRFGALVLVVLIPVVLFQSSGYKVDVALSTYLLLGLLYLIRLEARPGRTDRVRAILVTAGLFGFGMLTKKSGIIAFGFLFLFPLFHSGPPLQGLLRRARAPLLVALGAGILVAWYYLKGPEPLFLDPYPPFDAVRFTRELFRTGIPTVFWSSDHNNPGILLGWAASGVALTARARFGERSPLTNYLYAIVFLWIAASFAGVFALEEDVLFGRCDRYVLPICSIAAVLLVEQIEALWSFPGRGGDARRWLSRLGSVALVASVVLLTPGKRLHHAYTRRYSFLSDEPSASLSAKMEWVFGDRFLAWEDVNGRFEDHPNGKVLATDSLAYFLDPIVLTVANLPAPGGHSQKYYDWMKKEEVRWIIADPTWRDTEQPLHRRNLYNFLRSGYLEEEAQYGGYVIYSVRQVGAPRSAGWNPVHYVSRASVRLGGTFEATVDRSVSGKATSLLFGFDTPVDIKLSGGQRLLCLDTGGIGEVFTGAGLSPTSTAGETDSFSLAVPNSPRLQGFTFCSQAVAFGPPPFMLSNAYDHTIGP